MLRAFGVMVQKFSLNFKISSLLPVFNQICSKMSIISILINENLNQPHTLAGVNIMKYYKAILFYLTVCLV